MSDGGAGASPTAGNDRRARLARALPWILATMVAVQVVGAVVEGRGRRSEPVPLWRVRLEPTAAITDAQAGDASLILRDRIASHFPPPSGDDLAGTRLFLRGEADGDDVLLELPRTKAWRPIVEGALPPQRLALRAVDATVPGPCPAGAAAHVAHGGSCLRLGDAELDLLEISPHGHVSVRGEGGSGCEQVVEAPVQVALTPEGAARVDGLVRALAGRSLALLADGAAVVVTPPPPASWSPPGGHCFSAGTSPARERSERRFLLGVSREWKAAEETLDRGVLAAPFRIAGAEKVRR